MSWRLAALRPGPTVNLTLVLVSCDRREIRDLTDKDREAFFDAMQTWYTVPTSVGKITYGPDFSDYMSITATHGTDVRTARVLDDSSL